MFFCSTSNAFQALSNPGTFFEADAEAISALWESEIGQWGEALLSNAKCKIMVLLARPSWLAAEDWVDCSQSSLQVPAYTQLSHPTPTPRTQGSNCLWFVLLCYLELQTSLQSLSEARKRQVSGFLTGIGRNSCLLHTSQDKLPTRWLRVALWRAAGPLS